MADALPEISCENCVAACCKAPVAMTMTQKEFDRNAPKMDLKLIKKPVALTQLVQIEGTDAPVRLAAGCGVFLLQSGCDNLTEDHRCSIYSVRPNCCRDFTMGSPECLVTRRTAGLDSDRPVTEEEASIDSSDSLVRHFFPAPVDPQETIAPRSNVAPPVGLGLFDLHQLAGSVGRDADWISERLSSPEQTLWSRRTRLPGWSVGALAAHLVDGLLLADVVLRGAIEGQPVKSPNDFAGDHATTLRAFSTASDSVRVSLDRITQPMLAGEVIIDAESSVTVQHLVDVLSMELAVHALDLADTLGEPRELSADAISAIARALPELLDAGIAPRAGAAYVLRSSAFEIPLAWRHNSWAHREGANPCVVEGDPGAVLLYALGRVPYNKSALVTNQPDLARAFKRHLVGP